MLDIISCLLSPAVRDVHSLVIRSVRHAHAGVYKSVISNKIGKATCYAHLYVTGDILSFISCGCFRQFVAMVGNKIYQRNVISIINKQMTVLQLVGWVCSDWNDNTTIFLLKLLAQKSLITQFLAFVFCNT